MSGSRISVSLLPRKRPIVPGDIVGVGKYVSPHGVPLLELSDQTQLFWARSGDIALVISKAVMTRTVPRMGPVRKKVYLVFIDGKFGWLDKEYARRIVSGCGDAR